MPLLTLRMFRLLLPATSNADLRQEPAVSVIGKAGFINPFGRHFESSHHCADRFNGSRAID